MEAITCCGAVFTLHERSHRVALDGFLNVFLKITTIGLGITGVFLSFPSFFQILIADYFASEFLDFAFHLFKATFDLIFVHDGFLLMNIDDHPKRRTRTPALIDTEDVPKIIGGSVR